MADARLRRPPDRAAVAAIVSPAVATRARGAGREHRRAPDRLRACWTAGGRRAPCRSFGSRSSRRCSSGCPPRSSQHPTAIRPNPSTPTRAPPWRFFARTARPPADGDSKRCSERFPATAPRAGCQRVADQRPIAATSASADAVRLRSSSRARTTMRRRDARARRACRPASRRRGSLQRRAVSRRTRRPAPPVPNARSGSGRSGARARRRRVMARERDGALGGMSAMHTAR